MVNQNKNQSTITRNFKGSKPANYTYAVPTPGGRGSMGGETNGTMESVCAMTNPFCPAAKGSKIPDDDSANSIAITVKDTHTFDTDANGFGALSVQPYLQGTTRQASSVVAGVPVTYGADAPVADYAALAASFAEKRIVSFGVRVYSTLAPTEQSGAIRFITASARASAGTPLTGGLFDAVETYPVSGCDIHWVSRPTGTGWKDYRPFTALDDYSCLNVYVYGAKPSSVAAFTVEIVYNLECTVSLGTIPASISTPGKAHNPLALAAASGTHSKHNAIHPRKTFFGTLWGHAKSSILDAAATFMPGLAGKAARTLLGGGRRPYPMIVD